MKTFRSLSNLWREGIANTSFLQLMAISMIFINCLTPEESAIQLQVREFMQKEIKPIVNNYWLKDEFPFQIIPQLAKLNICGLTYEGYGCPGKSSLLEGFLAMEMARVDCSVSTFFGVQSGLAMGSIYYCGSEEQKQNGFRRCKGWS